MGYRKGLVYFIDVLGTKGRSFEDSIKIAERFQYELTGVQNRHNSNSIGNRCVMTFSDCAYIIYDFKENHLNDEFKRKAYIYQSFYNTSHTLAYFAANGFLFRGGVNYGDVYFDKEKNIIFGPAVDLSYKLESIDAKYPRVLIEDSLANEIIKFDISIKNDNSLLAATNGDIILQDNKDDKFFINYLNVFRDFSSVMLGNEVYDFELFYIKSKTISEYIVSKKPNEKILEKQLWHIGYLEEVKYLMENNAV